MSATMPVLTSSRIRGLGRQPWLCAHIMPASPRQARVTLVYSIRLASTCCPLSDGRIRDSGSRTGSVSAFGAVAPSSMPSSRPAADRETATLGLASLLQASLRMSVLISRSTGPLRTSRESGARSAGAVTPGVPAE